MKIFFLILIVSLIAFSFLQFNLGSCLFNCPSPKIFSVDGSGSVLKFQPSSFINSLTFLRIGAYSVNEVLTLANDKCTKSLKEDIKESISQCSTYCSAVVGCSSNAQIIGPNVCYGNVALDCKVVSEPYTYWLGIPRIPITINYDAWRCDVRETSQVHCVCD